VRREGTRLFFGCIWEKRLRQAANGTQSMAPNAGRGERNDALAGKIRDEDGLLRLIKLN